MVGLLMSSCLKESNYIDKSNVMESRAICRDIKNFKVVDKNNANNIPGSSIEFNYSVKACDPFSRLSIKVVMDDMTNGFPENKFLLLTLNANGKYFIPTEPNHNYRLIMLVYDVNPSQSALLDYARVDFTNNQFVYDHWNPEAE